MQSNGCPLTLALLDDVRVSTGKGIKPIPLHNFATVGVHDNVLVITAYEPEVRKCDSHFSDLEAH